MPVTPPVENIVMPPFILLRCLDSSDTCDKCHAAARMIVSFTGDGSLSFCAHHGREYFNWDDWPPKKLPPHPGS
jgi:hypothetical protein